MEFVWTYEKNHPQQIKYFLKEKGISKGLLAKIKFQGGEIKVNGQTENVLFSLSYNDKVTIVIPAEGEHETVLLDETPIEIVYEDEHLLVVNKPAGVSSIPAQYHPNYTMANRVKAYYKRQGYENQVIHVVTRLDRDTSGLMLFAKHGFAHAKLDVQLREKRFVKKYQALVSGERPIFFTETDGFDSWAKRTNRILVNEKHRRGCFGRYPTAYGENPSNQSSFFRNWLCAIRR